MDLVNKEDYISLALNFVHKTLNTALELSAELSSRNKRGQVEQIDLLVSKIERNIALVDPLGNTLRNGSLADTRFTDKAGIVLGPSGEYLDNARYLLVSADNAVKLSVRSFLREIGTIAAEEFQFLAALFLLASAEKSAFFALFLSLFRSVRAIAALGGVLAEIPVTVAAVVVVVSAHSEHIRKEVGHKSRAAHFKAVAVKHTHHLIRKLVKLLVSDTKLIHIFRHLRYLLFPCA